MTRPHRVVIRTTPEHYSQIQAFAQKRGAQLSSLLRELLSLGLTSWRRWSPRDVDVPYFGINKCMLLQVRMPDGLFQDLETIIDDMECTRTDIYLRMIELGEESLDAENAS